MIQLTRTRLRCDIDDGAIERLADVFASTHLLRLPAFLDDGLRATVDRRLAGAAFQTRVEKGLEIEETIVDPALVALFTLTLNDPRLFALVDRLTGCGPIGCFTGRIYRRRASRGADDRYYPWHNDIADDRLIGLSINLGQDPYEGGVLQLRVAASREPIGEVSNTGHGDAVLFRISNTLEHQVTPVSGDVPRTVMAGWFRRQPSYLDLVARETASARAVCGDPTPGPDGLKPVPTA